MATDRLRQVGRSLNKSKNFIDTTVRNYSTNLTLVERSLDLITPINTYNLEFKTYGESGQVFLTLQFYERYDDKGGAAWLLRATN